MIEAKLQEDIANNADKNRVRFEAGRSWCRENDACFCLLDERDIKTTYLANVRTLAESRAATIGEAARAAVSRLRLTRGSTVASATSGLLELGVAQAEALTAIEKAVVERILDCDLTKPFDLNTHLRRQPDGRPRPERADPFLAVLRRAGRRDRG